MGKIKISKGIISQAGDFFLGGWGKTGGRGGITGGTGGEGGGVGEIGG